MAITGGFLRYYTYSSLGIPTGRKAQVGNNVIFDESYSFDNDMNLLSRTDNKRNLTEQFTYDNLGRLTSYGGNNVVYTNNGNIVVRSDVGTMFYANTAKPYAISGITPVNNSVPMRNQSITYTTFSRPYQMQEGYNSATFVYNSEMKRVRMDTSDGGNHATYYYLGDCYERSSGDIIPTTERIYLMGDYYDAPAVYVKTGNNEDTRYIIRDYLGSVRAVSNYYGSSTEEYSFDAWGRMRKLNNWQVYAPDSVPSLYLGRGFTGHEHLPVFGIINMNARLYDPAVGRFLSPDPYVQRPDFTQNFNRYSYALNNPLKYVDENGEYWHLLIGAAVGGVANLISNWKNINGFWQGFTSFMAGAGAGLAVAATGGASSGVIIGVAAASGAGTAATNSIIAQTGENFQGIDNINWSTVGKSSCVGGVAGAAGGAVGSYASSASWMVNGISSPVLRSAVTSPLAAGAGHIVGGTTYGLLEGDSFGKAFANSFNGIGKSMIYEGAIGVVTTIGTCYSTGINPWNGKIMSGYEVTAKDLHLENDVQRINDGVRLPYRNDRTTFANDPSRSGYLPQGPQYMEYVVPTPGIQGPGPQRIVVGNNGSWYYTPDHYQTFLKFKP